MARWRQAVELAMTDEEIEVLTALSRSRTEPASRVSRAAMLLGLSREAIVLCRGTKAWCASSDGPALRRTGDGLWRRWRHSMTDRDRARSPRSRRRPRRGWYRWRATRPRSTAIRTSCGRRGFWPAMRASMDRRRVTTVSPVWFRARCASFSAKRKSSRTRCATIWKIATPSSNRKWRRFCASIARSRS